MVAVKHCKSCEVVQSWYMELVKYEKTWQSYGDETMKELRNGTKLAHRVSKIWKHDKVMTCKH